MSQNKIYILNAVPDDLPLNIKPIPVYKDWVILNDVSGKQFPITVEYTVKDDFGVGPTTLTDELSEGQYNLWVKSGFNPLSLLLLLTVEDNGCDDYYDVCYPTTDEAIDFLLGVVIKGCCGCGMPARALPALSKVMSGFRYHPEYQKDYDIYADGAHLALGYVIDAQGELIEHGGSIGSSWMEAKGAIWSLAALFVIQEIKKEGEYDV